MVEQRPDIESQVLDVTDIDLETLQELGNPVLAESILRILREADQPGEALSGFNSSI
jgi:FXSXX-COOH protein